MPAIERMTKEDFAELRKQIWLMARAARDGDLLKMVETGLRLRDIVISSTDQPHTAQICHSTFLPRIRAYFHRYCLDPRGDGGRHAELLEVLQTGDCERAAPGRAAHRGPHLARRRGGAHSSAGELVC